MPKQRNYNFIMKTTMKTSTKRNFREGKKKENPTHETNYKVQARTSVALKGK